MKERILYIIIVLTSTPKISDDDTFRDLGMDSLDFLGFIIHVEDEFKIRIKDWEASNRDTVGAFYKLIDKKIKI